MTTKTMFVSSGLAKLQNEICVICGLFPRPRSAASRYWLSISQQLPGAMPPIGLASGATLHSYPHQSASIRGRFFIGVHSRFNSCLFAIT
jgi:hypothetical protein